MLLVRPAVRTVAVGPAVAAVGAGEAQLEAGDLVEEPAIDADAHAATVASAWTRVYPRSDAMSDQLVRVSTGGLLVVSAVTTEALRESVRRHAVCGEAAVALGRALSSAALLAEVDVGVVRVTLELGGAGPLGVLRADAKRTGELCASVARVVPFVMASPSASAGRTSLAAALGANGALRVEREIDAGARTIAHGSLVTGEVDEDLAAWLNTLDSSRWALGCDVLLDADGAPMRSAGLLVVAGDHAGDEVARVAQALQGGALWRALLAGEARASSLPFAKGLLAPTSRSVAGEARALRFHCDCSSERARGALEFLRADELAAMLDELGSAEVVCHRCSLKHSVARSELEALRLPASLRDANP